MSLRRVGLASPVITEMSVGPSTVGYVSVSVPLQVRSKNAVPTHLVPMVADLDTDGWSLEDDTITEIRAMRNSDAKRRGDLEYGSGLGWS
jgi:hypothetical protein